MPIDPDHQMQMAAGRESGGTDVPDDLPLTDVLTHPDDVVTCVVVAGRQVPAADVAVVDHQPVAVTGVVVPLSHPARVCGVDWCAASGAEIGTVVQLPVVQYRMETHAER